MSINQYWSFQYASDYNIPEEKFVDQLVKSFKKAVESRMEGSHRYCVSLSDGLDSRSIIAAIDESKRRDIYAFTFGPLDCDELKIAKEVAKRSKAKFLHADITPDIIIDNAEEEVYLTDGRNYIGVSFIYPVFKSIKDLVDTVFGGFELDVVLGASYSSRKIQKCRNRGSFIKRCCRAFIPYF